MKHWFCREVDIPSLETLMVRLDLKAGQDPHPGNTIRVSPPAPTVCCPCAGGAQHLGPTDSGKGRKGTVLLTCLEFASSRFRSHREVALRSQQVRWCWHPEAAVRAGRGTGLGSAWLALHSAAAPAAAGADWPARVQHVLRGQLARSFNRDEEEKSEIRGKSALS